MEGSAEELIVQWRSRAEAYRSLSASCLTQPGRRAYDHLAMRCEDVARSMASRHRVARRSDED